MGASGWEIFCEGPVWNDTLLLENTWPQFTECFLYTILIWVPCAFLFLLLPYYVTSVNGQEKRGTSYPITLVNGSRLFCCITLALLSLINLLYRTDEDDVNTSIAAYLGDALIIAAYILMAFMSQYERLKGVEPTAVPFFFWLLSVICQTVPFYTFIIQEEYKDHLVVFVVFTLRYILQVVCLILTAFTSSRDSEYSPMDMPPCPETTCSFPAFLFFWWMTKLMITGYKRDLQESDLWMLPNSERSNRLVPVYQRLWQKEHHRCQKLNSKKQQVKLMSVRYISDNSMDSSAVNGKMPTEKTALLSKDTETEQEDKKAKPSLMRVIVGMHWKAFVISYIQKVTSDLILLCSPVLLGVLMTHLRERPSGRDWQGFVICGGMFLTIICKSVLFAHSMFESTRIGIRIKATLIAAVYQKALTMSSAAKQTSTVGEVVNLMSVDAQRILDMMGVFFFAFTTPVQIIFSIALLYTTIGPSIFAGVVLLALLMPVNIYVVNKQRDLQTRNLQFKDIRIRLYNEILSGIKVLKLYAWEASFREKIREIRLKEVAILFKLALLNTMMSLSWDMAPYLVTLVTFATYVLSDPNSFLDAEKAFVSLALFNILRAPLNLLSTMIVYIIQAKVSIDRVNSFLHNEDLDPDAVIHDKTAEHIIAIKGGEFSWDKTTQPALKNINLEVKEGQLVAVVGPVGCGKSSLINAILGEMEKVKGTVSFRGSVAYVPQQAWIQNATVRDNILFGQPYIRSKYRTVLEKCELERDLTILSAGDMTEIGEKVGWCVSTLANHSRYTTSIGSFTGGCFPMDASKPKPNSYAPAKKVRGINLSGGQKQRVSVARAVYSEHEVYLLDDPLSAVDSHVGKAMFNNVIGPNGILKKKTRVLVTHGVHWLPMVDRIVVMTDGTISEQGSYDELMSHDGPFAQFLKTYLTEVQDDDDEDDPELLAIRDRMARRLDSVTSDGGFSSADELSRQTRKRLKKRKESRGEEVKQKTADLEDSVASVMPCKEAEVTAQLVGRLTTTETVETGKVKRQVFKDYAQAAGLLLLSLAFLSYCVFQAFSVSANFWLNMWTADSRLLNASTSTNDSDSTNILESGNHFYLGIYGVFGIFQLFFLFGFNYLFWTRMATAARILHARLADRIFQAPMAFFDTTPIGRILNRASRDVETVDNTLPLIIRDWLITFALVLLTLVVIMIQTPLSGVVLLPVVVLYYFCQGFYVPMARQVKRIEAVTRTPIYVLFSETMNGASSIRAYGATDWFLEESKARVDRNQIFYFASQAAVRWLQFNLDILAACVVLAAGLFAMLNTSSGPGDAGLSVSYALQVSGTLTWMTRQICEFETNIVSVERLKEYSELDTEADWVIRGKRPPVSWPQQGEVTFDNYQTRYREGLELVLKGVTCTINHGEKIGIVGRTGAGKSSLTLSLFRLIEAAGGCILIDGINIADMGLHDLRSRLTILPQPHDLDGRGGDMRDIFAVIIRHSALSSAFRIKVGVSRMMCQRTGDPFALHHISRALHRSVIPDRRLKATHDPYALDPVLFSGTLRMNLDPFDQYSDSQLWTALDRAHLRQAVMALPGELAFICAEEGSNLSVGQRQLVCLARTLLRKTQILVLDEATAAVDMETDALIQNTIRSAFSSCTVITIAHRLNTIMDYDKIMVMDAGVIKEMAPPEELLSNKRSTFYSMARDAGLV